MTARRDDSVGYQAAVLIAGLVLVVCAWRLGWAVFA